MIGPDLFGFFAREVADLLSQDEDILPSSIESEAGSMPIRVMDNGKVSESIVNPSFVNSLGAALPNLKRELLMALLRQIVSNFTQEVDEMLDPVIRIRQMLSLLRGRKNNSGRKIILGLRAREGSHKKLKVSASSSLAGIPAQQSMINHGSDKEVNDDFKFLLETENSLQLEETVKKHSDEVSQTLSHMEQQLEELLDTVVSKCRQMTQPEKQQLLKQVKKLHPKNLDRVVEIIKRKEPTESPSSEDVFVDLEKQENVTLWRLYFYIQAVENAWKISA
ncbi:hypothetical protein Droror1_Dr00027542 [Drosera rotundifolia]